MVGTMIEIPRAALLADRIAEEAEFFSFGTNDLTQMTYGFSRDDVGAFVPEYVEKKIIPVDPFQILDQAGVGQLIQLGVERGRKARPGLKGRHLRRARRRAFERYVLPPRRHGLCQLFSLSYTDSASGCRSGRGRGEKEFAEAKSKGVAKQR